MKDEILSEVPLNCLSELDDMHKEIKNQKKKLIDQEISFYASVLGRHLDRVGFGRCDVMIGIIGGKF